MLVKERDVLAAAVALLEQAYGPNDPRLAYPLWTTGMSYSGWSQSHCRFLGG